MFKKINFKGLNYKDLDRINSHDLKHDEMQSFYQTFDFLEMVKKWPQIVGPKLCTVTSPLKISHSSLFIITKHSIYSQELSFLSNEIMGEIFKVFPHLKPIIKKLVFQTHEKFFEQQKVQEKANQEIRTKLHPQSPQYKLLKQEADRLFGSIEEKELREMMVSIYIQSKI
ncbi:MAG: DciA family protein [Bacteriovoracaceae bacterium]